MGRRRTSLSGQAPPARTTRTTTAAMEKERSRAAERAQSVLSVNQMIRWSVVLLVPLFLVALCVAGPHSQFLADAIWKGKEAFREHGAKFLFSAQQYLWRVAGVLSNLSGESLRGYVEQLRETHGSWVVNCAAGASLGLLLLFLAVIASRRSRSKIQTTKNSSKARRKKVAGSAGSAQNVKVVLSGSEFEDEEEVEDEDDDAIDEALGPEALEGPELIYVDKKLSAEEYEKATETATQRELVKLLKSSEFRELVKERGKDDAAFNWQKRRSARLAAAASAGGASSTR